ncbi:uncharacterized protein LOC143461280 isoform X2 [Clavelina lepadiformis]|uniref:uncharacterized protein LOC143461280 isoform X2 n=1 Tax=Clavelina lepadiformis TaxID=159417 RepID=UPI004042AE25
MRSRSRENDLVDQDFVRQVSFTYPKITFSQQTSCFRGRRQIQVLFRDSKYNISKRDLTTETRLKNIVYVITGVRPRSQVYIYDVGNHLPASPDQTKSGSHLVESLTETKDLDCYLIHYNEPKIIDNQPSPVEKNAMSQSEEPESSSVDTIKARTLDIPLEANRKMETIDTPQRDLKEDDSSSCSETDTSSTWSDSSDNGERLVDEVQNDLKRDKGDYLSSQHTENDIFSDDDIHQSSFDGFALTTSSCRVLTAEDALPFARKFGSVGDILMACKRELPLTYSSKHFAMELQQNQLKNDEETLSDIYKQFRGMCTDNCEAKRTGGFENGLTAPTSKTAAEGNLKKSQTRYLDESFASKTLPRCHKTSARLNSNSNSPPCNILQAGLTPSPLLDKHKPPVEAPLDFPQEGTESLNAGSNPGKKVPKNKAQPCSTGQKEELSKTEDNLERPESRESKSFKGSLRAASVSSLVKFFDKRKKGLKKRFSMKRVIDLTRLNTRETQTGSPEFPKETKTAKRHDVTKTRCHSSSCTSENIKDIVDKKTISKSQTTQCFFEAKGHTTCAVPALAAVNTVVPEGEDICFAPANSKAKFDKLLKDQGNEASSEVEPKNEVGPENFVAAKELSNDTASLSCTPESTYTAVASNTTEHKDDFEITPEPIVSDIVDITAEDKGVQHSSSTTEDTSSEFPRQKIEENAFSKPINTQDIVANGIVDVPTKPDLVDKSEPKRFSQDDSLHQICKPYPHQETEISNDDLPHPPKKFLGNSISKEKEFPCSASDPSVSPTSSPSLSHLDDSGGEDSKETAADTGFESETSTELNLSNRANVKVPTSFTPNVIVNPSNNPSPSFNTSSIATSSTTKDHSKGKEAMSNKELKKDFLKVPSQGKSMERNFDTDRENIPRKTKKSRRVNSSGEFSKVSSFPDSTLKTKSRDSSSTIESIIDEYDEELLRRLLTTPNKPKRRRNVNIEKQKPLGSYFPADMLDGSLNKTEERKPSTSMPSADKLIHEERRLEVAEEQSSGRPSLHNVRPQLQSQDQNLNHRLTLAHANPEGPYNSHAATPPSSEHPYNGFNVQSRDIYSEYGAVRPRMDVPYGALPMLRGVERPLFHELRLPMVSGSVRQPFRSPIPGNPYNPSFMQAPMRTQFPLSNPFRNSWVSGMPTAPHWGPRHIRGQNMIPPNFPYMKSGPPPRIPFEYGADSAYLPSFNQNPQFHKFRESRPPYVSPHVRQDNFMPEYEPEYQDYPEMDPRYEEDEYEEDYNRENLHEWLDEIEDDCHRLQIDSNVYDSREDLRYQNTNSKQYDDNIYGVNDPYKGFNVRPGISQRFIPAHKKSTRTLTPRPSFNRSSTPSLRPPQHSASFRMSRPTRGQEAQKEAEADPDQASYSDFLADFTQELRNPNLNQRERNFRYKVMGQMQRLMPVVPWPYLMPFYDVALRKFESSSRLITTSEQKDEDARLILDEMVRDVLATQGERDGGNVHDPYSFHKRYDPHHNESFYDQQMTHRR